MSALAIAKKKPNDATEQKKLKISEAQQKMFLSVLIAALALGAAIMVSLYLIKYISFNAKVIEAKEESVKAYTSVIKNVGVCAKPNGGTYTIDEIKKCNPNALSAEQVSDSLRGKILLSMTSNTSLESVARSAQLTSKCYGADGKRISYEELYEKYNSATSEAASDTYLALLITCSSLRVVADALPASLNVPASLASLSYMINKSGLEIESLTSDEDSTGMVMEEEEDLTGARTLQIGQIAIPLTITGTDEQIEVFLENLERSIREYTVNSAEIKWNGDNRLEIALRLTAYYVENAGVIETNLEVEPE